MCIQRVVCLALSSSTLVKALVLVNSDNTARE
jgi:hypothetical protein